MSAITDKIYTIEPRELLNFCLSTYLDYWSNSSSFLNLDCFELEELDHYVVKKCFQHISVKDLNYLIRDHINETSYLIIKIQNYLAWEPSF